MLSKAVRKCILSTLKSISLSYGTRWYFFHSVLHALPLTIELTHKKRIVYGNVLMNEDANIECDPYEN